MDQLAFLVCFGICAVAIFAQNPNPTSGINFDNVDRNKNQNVDLLEWLEMGITNFKYADKNGDLQIQGGVEWPQDSPIFRTSDLDRNGIVDNKETGQDLVSMFLARDSNGNGILDRNEINVLPPPNGGWVNICKITPQYSPVQAPNAPPPFGTSGINFNNVDANNDQKVDITEWLAMGISNFKYADKNGDLQVARAEWVLKSSIFDRSDLDRNGFVDPKETGMDLLAMFLARDTNGNAFLDRAEIQAPAPANSGWASICNPANNNPISLPAVQQLTPLQSNPATNSLSGINFDKVDTNNNQLVDMTEWLNMGIANFKNSDKNGDLQLGRSEWTLKPSIFERSDINRNGFLDTKETGLDLVSMFLARDSNDNSLLDRGEIGAPAPATGGWANICKSQKQYIPVIISPQTGTSGLNFDNMDTNRDQNVDMMEWLNMGLSNFKNSDKNGDLQLSRAEWTLEGFIFERSDLDRNGFLDHKETGMDLVSMFIARDKDGNSYLDRSEIEAPAPTNGGWTNICNPQSATKTEFQFTLPQVSNALSSNPATGVSGIDFDNLDTNSDNIVDMTEWLTMGITNFKNMDKNGDLHVAQAEWTLQLSIFERSDVDRNGYIDSRETGMDLSAMYLARDKDGNGYLDRSEVEAAAPPTGGWVNLCSSSTPRFSSQLQRDPVQVPSALPVPAQNLGADPKKAQYVPPAALQTGPQAAPLPGVSGGAAQWNPAAHWNSAAQWNPAGAGAQTQGGAPVGSQQWVANFQTDWENKLKAASIQFPTSQAQAQPQTGWGNQGGWPGAAGQFSGAAGAQGWPGALGAAGAAGWPWAQGWAGAGWSGANGAQGWGQGASSGFGGVLSGWPTTSGGQFLTGRGGFPGSGAANWFGASAQAWQGQGATAGQRWQAGAGQVPQGAGAAQRTSAADQAQTANGATGLSEKKTKNAS